MGQGLVEFALVLPLILLILLGTIDVGRWVFADNSVTNAAREGMRAAIVNQFEPDIRAVVARQATALSIATTTPTGCDSSNVPTDPTGVCIKFVDQDALTTPCNPLYVGCVAVVTVKTTYQAITPVIGSLLGSRPIVSTSKQPIESVCTASSGCPVP